MGDESVFEAYAGNGKRYAGMQVSSFYIPVRDGTRLAVDLYLPKELQPSDQIPAILIQTRYWRAMQFRAPFSWLLRGAGDLSPLGRGARRFYAEHGYATLVVDVRGTGASFGCWKAPWEAVTVDDAYDLLEWICAQSWSNGRVAGMGVSYLGTAAELLLATGHPAVRAVVPQFNHPDSFTDVGFPGGLLNERFVRAWGELDERLDRNEMSGGFSPLLKWIADGVKAVDGKDGAALLAQALEMHKANTRIARMQDEVTYRDEPMAETGLSADDQAVMRFRERVLNSQTPVMGIASWMDAGTANAALRRFASYPGLQRVVIGAWNHGGAQQSSPYLGAQAPHSPGNAALRGEVLRFLDACLKQDEPGAGLERAAFTYELGSERWRKHADWPPRGTWRQRWYFGAGRGLSPAAGSESGQDEFSVDFEHTTGTYNRWWELGVIDGKPVDTSGREQQAGRVLAYESAPLEEDLQIAGWPVAALRVACSLADCAFYVYLEDVFPDGRIVGLTEGQLRGLHRRVSAEPGPYRLEIPYHTFRQADALPLVPGQAAEIEIGLLPVEAMLQRGHRLRVALAGHDAGTFPRVPKEGTPVWTVYWGSSLSLPRK